MYSQNQNLSAGKYCPVNRAIAPVVRGWVKHNNTEPGIGAGTQRLLAALFLAAHACRPSQRVRPLQRSLGRRFGRLVVPGGRPRDRPVFRCSLLLARDPARRMLSRHFPVAWVCSGGDRRRGCGQTAQLAPWASVTVPALRPVIPRHPAPATDSLAGFGRCRLSRVSDTRSKPLNQEASING